MHVAQELAGHKSIITTRRYMKVFSPDKFAAIDSMEKIQD